jgi:hypothetical protein
VTARIKEYLQRYRDEALREDSPDYDLDFGTGGEEFANIVSGSGRLKEALEKVRGISEHTKIVAAILDFLNALLPRRIFVVSGTLDCVSAKTASVTLFLAQDGRQKAAVALSAPASAQPPSADDYGQLAQPAAIWVQYEIARRLVRKSSIGPNDAASYALLREGLDCHLAGDDAGALEVLQEAVSLKPRNWAARANIAVLQARGEAGAEAAITTVRVALDDMRATV